MLIRIVLLSLCSGFLNAITAQTPAAKPTQAVDAPVHNSTYIGPDGTAYITRVVPVPKTVSTEAQALLATQIPDTPPSGVQDIVAARKRAELRRETTGKALLVRYPAKIEAGAIAGVPVTIVSPTGASSEIKPYVLINLHGGRISSTSRLW
jgi:hypothetical protein